MKNGKTDSKHEIKNKESIDRILKSYEKYFEYYEEFKEDLLTFFEKKNQIKNWHKICSIQDWINVTVNRIKNLRFDEFQTLSTDDKTFFIIELITCINVLVDSTEGLKYIIGLTTDEYLVFINALDSFQKTKKMNHEHDSYLGITNRNDRDYFKHIRAAFGQHPSNLEINGKRVFASWTLSYDMHEEDLYIFVYVNDPNAPWGYRENIIISDLLLFYKNFFDVALKLLEILRKKVQGFFDELVVDSLYNKDDNLYTKILKTKKGIIKRYHGDEKSYYYICLVEIDEGLHKISKNIQMLFKSEYNEYIRILYDAFCEIHERVKNCSKENLVIFSEVDVSWVDISKYDYIPKKAEAYMDGDKRHYDNYLYSCKEIADVLEFDAIEIKTFADYRFLKYVLKKRNLFVFKE